MSIQQFIFKIFIDKLNISKQYAGNVQNFLVEGKFESIDFVIPFNQIGSDIFKEQERFKFSCTAIELAEKMKNLPLKIVIKSKDQEKDFNGKFGGEIECKWPQNLIDKLYEHDFVYHSCLFTQDIVQKDKKIGEVSLIVIIRRERSKEFESLQNQSSDNNCFVEESEKLQKNGNDILYVMGSNMGDDESQNNSTSSSQYCTSPSKDLSDIDYALINSRDNLNFACEVHQKGGTEVYANDYEDKSPYATNKRDLENNVSCAANFRYSTNIREEENSFDLICCYQDKNRSEKKRSYQNYEIQNTHEHQVNCQTCYQEDSHTAICEYKQYTDEEAKFPYPNNNEMQLINQNCIKSKMCCKTSSCPTVCLCASCKTNTQQAQLNRYEPIADETEKPNDCKCRKCLCPNINRLPENDNIRMKCEIYCEKSPCQNICSCTGRKTEETHYQQVLKQVQTNPCQQIEDRVEMLRNCKGTKLSFPNNGELMKCEICCKKSSCQKECSCLGRKIDNIKSVENRCQQFLQQAHTNRYQSNEEDVEKPKNCKDTKSLYLNTAEGKDCTRINCEICCKKPSCQKECSCLWRKIDNIKSVENHCQQFVKQAHINRCLSNEEDVENPTNSKNTKSLYLNTAEGKDCFRTKCEVCCKITTCQNVCSCVLRNTDIPKPEENCCQQILQQDHASRYQPIIENDAEIKRNCTATKLLQSNIDELEENNFTRLNCEVCCKNATCQNVCSCVWRKTNKIQPEKIRCQLILNEFEKHMICNCCCKICRLKRKFLKYIQNNSDSVVSYSEVNSVGSYSQNSIRSRKPKSSLKVFNELTKMLRKMNKHIKSINKKLDILECSCENPNKYQCMKYKNKRKLKRKKHLKKICKINARKKKIRSQKYCYNHGEQYPANIVGHKDCIECTPQVPPNMGWMWNDGKESRQGWRPGAIRKPVREIMSHFLEDYPIDNLPSNKTKNTLLCKPILTEERKSFPNIYITKKNGGYKITLNSSPRIRCTNTHAKPIQCKAHNECCIPKEERIICLSSSNSICCRGRCYDSCSGLNIAFEQPTKKPDFICRETQYQDSDWNFIQKSRDLKIAENKKQIKSMNVKKEFEIPEKTKNVEERTESKQFSSKPGRNDDVKVKKEYAMNKKNKKYEAKRVTGNSVEERKINSRKPDLKIKEPHHKRNSGRGFRPKETPRILMSKRLPYKQCQQYDPCTISQQPYYDNVSSCYSFPQPYDQNISCDTIEAPCESYYNVN